MLATLERDIHEGLAIGRMADGWLHRATRETDAGLIHGRPALMAATARELAETGRQEILDPLELPGFLAVTVRDGRGRSWRRHRWVSIESGRIAREVLVADHHPGAPTAPARWPALGEIESGRGQRPAPDTPPFADPLSPHASAVATLIHRIINARRFDLAAPAFSRDGDWDGPGAAGGDPMTIAPVLVRLIAAAPDLHATLDQVAEGPDAVATVWRVAGTGPHSARFSGFASCLARLDGALIRRLNVVADPEGILAAAAAPTLAL